MVAVAILAWMFVQFLFVPSMVGIVVMILPLVGLAELLLVLGGPLGLVLALVQTPILAFALLAAIHAARYRRRR